MKRTGGPDAHSDGAGGNENALDLGMALPPRPGERRTPRRPGLVRIGAALQEHAGHRPLPPSRRHPQGRCAILVVDGVDVGAVIE